MKTTLGNCDTEIVIGLIRFKQSRIGTVSGMCYVECARLRRSSDFHMPSVKPPTPENVSAREDGHTRKADTVSEFCWPLGAELLFSAVHATSCAGLAAASGSADILVTVNGFFNPVEVGVPATADWIVRRCLARSPTILAPAGSPAHWPARISERSAKPWLLRPGRPRAEGISCLRRRELNDASHHSMKKQQPWAHLLPPTSALGRQT